MSDSGCRADNLLRATGPIGLAVSRVPQAAKSPWRGF
jgi:hypothetical protein